MIMVVLASLQQFNPNTYLGNSCLHSCLAGMPVMAQAQLANTVRGWLRSHVQTGILFEDEKFAKPSLLLPSVNQPPVPQAHQPETPVQTAAAPVGHLNVSAPICLSGCVSRL